MKRNILNQIKIKAFTLAEILIVMTILGVLIAVMLHNLNLDKINDRKYKTAAVKVIQEFNVASAKIRDLEKTKCPTATFTVDVAGTEEYTLTTNGSTLMTSTSDVMNLFGTYIKFDYPSSGYYNFCSKTGWKDCPTGISAARLGGDIYVGLKVTATSTSLSSCPSYYRIDTNVKNEGTNTSVTPGSSTKCWANLYIDVNGKQGPNTLGQDVFVYGMDKSGVLY